MKVEGVKAVNSLEITQTSDKFKYNTYDYFYNVDTGEMQITDYGNDPLFSGIYNWKYNFEENTYNGVILPSTEPSIFELKNPNQNIIGIVH
jgi:hypothetical protein